MRKANLLIIDLIPSKDFGCTLRDIVESSTELKALVQYECAPENQTDRWENKLAQTVAGQAPDLVILILSRDKLNQTEAMVQSMRSENSVLPILFFAQDCRPDEMLSVLKFGATDFITPPPKDVEILPRIWRLIEHQQVQGHLTYRLKEKLGLRQLIGESLQFLDEIKKIPMIAGCDANVLITGETGTGKDMCARAIHYLSPRGGSPFIPFNCGAVPADLLENELFGHIQGAFTGASKNQTGLICAADGGTLFLDDIDCLPATSQAKLLHFLQEKEYRQLGSAKMLQADVRVIAATNVDLEEAVANGRLRQDLYYRLNVISLTMPPLRERREDIPLLARHFLNRHAKALNRSVDVFDSHAMRMLMLYDWPGNVRELEHVVERALVFCESNIVRKTDITLPKPKTSADTASFKEAKAAVVSQFERNYIEGLLQACMGNITRAAETAQKNRRAFWQLIRKHEIDVQTFKPG